MHPALFENLDGDTKPRSDAVGLGLHRVADD
jgi:hypothetical protein